MSGAKRVVFTTWGSFGDLHPFMALALELQGRGYDSVIATSPIYRDKVKAERLGFHPVRPDLPPPDAETSAAIIRRVSHARWGPSYLFRQLLVPHLRETYADTLAAVTGADLLVSHQVPLTAPLVAAKTGIKWISSVLFPIAFVSAHDPPTPPQLPQAGRCPLFRSDKISRTMRVGACDLASRGRSHRLSLQLLA